MKTVQTIKTTVITCSLVSIGCLTMVGDLLGLEPLKGVGLATHASPAPKVFTTQQGFETFSPQFQLSWMNESGQSEHLMLTREVYKYLHGPYNRRNAYGAAISYGPVLVANEHTRGMLASVSQYAFCGDNNLIHELTNNTVKTTSHPKILIIPRSSQEKVLSGKAWQLAFEINCSKEKS